MLLVMEGVVNGWVVVLAVEEDVVEMKKRMVWTGHILFVVMVALMIR